MLGYFSGAFGEFKQIRWLSVGRAFVLTIIVIVATFFAGFALGAVDRLFATLLRIVIV